MPRQNGLADKPGFTNSNHPELSALRINGEKQFLEIVSRAITANRGVLVSAAEALGVNRETLRAWIKRYPGVLQRALDEARKKARSEDEADREES